MGEENNVEPNSEAVKETILSLGFPSLPDGFEAGEPPTNSLHSPKNKDLEEGDFLLREQIGRGGQATVWAAWQRRLDREIAVKIHEGKDSDAFLREAFITADLEHPNIVPVHDLGSVRSTDGALRLVMAMKNIRGQRLDQIIAEDHKEPFADLAEILSKRLPVVLSVCNAVAFAHDREILHLDIKPSQVMVGEFGEVVLMDWGLAVVLGNSSPKVPDTLQEKFRTVRSIRGPVGTPAFMAPEQAAGDYENLSFATDVYLLGALTWSIVSGRALRPETDLQETVAAAVRNEQGPLPANVPFALQQILEKATHQSPSERYQSVAEFRDELAGFHQSVGRQLESSELTVQVMNPCQSNDEVYGYFREREGLLERALLLWPENEKASIELERIRTEHADHAVERGDLGLAATLIERLGDGEKRTELQTKLTAALKIVRRGVLLRRTAIAAAMALLGVLAVVSFAAYRQVSGALHAASIARSETRYESYVAGLRAASVALADERPRVAREFLHGVPEEYRSWEWDYLLSAAYPERRLVPPISTGTVELPRTVLSPNGQWKAICNEEGTLTIQAVNGSMQPVELGRLAYPTSFDFSPDNQWFIAATEESGINVFRVASWSSSQRFVYDKAPIRWLQFDDQSNRFVATTLDEVSVFNEDRVIVHRITPDMGKFTAIEPNFSMDEITIWNETEGAVFGLTRDEAHFEYSFAGDPILAYEVVENASFRVIGTTAGDIRKLDTSGELPYLTERWYAASGVREIDMSASGEDVVLLDGDGSVRWLLPDRVRVPITEDSDATALAIHPAGSHVVVAQSSGVTVYDRTGKATLTIATDANRIVEADWSQDGNRISLADETGGISVYDAATGSKIAKRSTTNEWLDMRFDPTSSRLALVSSSHTAILCGSETLEELCRFEGLGDGAFRGVEFSPDGKRLLTVGADGFLRVWDVSNGRELVALEAHRYGANHVRMEWKSGLLGTIGGDRNISSRRPFKAGLYPSPDDSIEQANEALAARVRRLP